MEKHIKNKTFENENFNYAEGITNSCFENVVFSNCKFSRKIEKCTFKNCQFINCKMYDMLFRWNILEDSIINNAIIINNSSVRENKFINTKINHFNVVALGLCYNEYTDCVFDDIADLIVLRRYDTYFPNPDKTVLTIPNNVYHNCSVNFNSIKKLSQETFGYIMMGGSRTKPKIDYPLNSYMDDNNCEVIWNFADLNYEQRLYYIVALTIFFINVNVNNKSLKYCDVSLKFIRTEFSDEIKFFMDGKYLNTTQIEPIDSIMYNCEQNPVPLTKEVPDIENEIYWKKITPDLKRSLKMKDS